jgi:hypothetical protein
MDSFAFHPELFELRNDVLEMLGDNGFAWLSDFGSIDLLHDAYGLEVCGIVEEADARTIKRLLHKMFASWRYSRMFYREGWTREPGWKIIISRDPEDFGDKWERVS